MKSRHYSAERKEWNRCFVSAMMFDDRLPDGSR
jgi:hypothetical protein